MSQPLTIPLKETVFDKENTLVITPESIEYKNASLSKFDVDEIRYGVSFIRGYSFYIGRIYCIDIKSHSGTIIKIRLKSLYGIRKKRLCKKYSIIVDALWENYMRDVAENFINFYKNKIDFDLLGIIFSQAGIQLSKQSDLVPWEDVGTKNYSRYYAIFSKENPHNYKAFYYLEDWNTSILYYVSRYILKAKKLV
ncbi:MAG: hypothetical protein KGM16_14285 [Bacteroidota bacterium]|nr:hypothetical protein [Bacteroidota bacterium]